MEWLNLTELLLGTFLTIITTTAVYFELTEDCKGEVKKVSKLDLYEPDDEQNDTSSIWGFFVNITPQPVVY